MKPRAPEIGLLGDLHFFSRVLREKKSDLLFCSLDNHRIILMALTRSPVDNKIAHSLKVACGYSRDEILL